MRPVRLVRPDNKASWEVPVLPDQPVLRGLQDLRVWLAVRVVQVLADSQALQVLLGFQVSLLLTLTFT